MDKITPRQALKELKKRYGKNFSLQDDDRTHIIEQALTELEETKLMKESFENDAKRLNQQCFDLLKVNQKQKQILEVLKKKKVNFLDLEENIINCDREERVLELYNKRYPYDEEYNDTQLTETEFKLLKEWLAK